MENDLPQQPSHNPSFTPDTYQKQIIIAFIFIFTITIVGIGFIQSQIRSSTTDQKITHPDIDTSQSPTPTFITEIHTPTTTNILTSPTPSITVPIEKEKQYYQLATINNIHYKLQWMATPTDSVNNMGELINLIKVVNNEEVVIKENILQLNSIEKGGYFHYLAQPQNSYKVLLEQGFEGTGGRQTLLINLENGNILYTYNFLNKRSGEKGVHCSSSVPFQENNINQRSYIYTCFFQDKNIESLFIFDLISELEREVLSLEPGETFSCEAGYSHNYIYKYLSPTVLNMSICLSTDKKYPKEVIRTINIDI